MINSKNKPIKLTGDSNSQSKQSRIEQQIEKLTKSIDSLNKSTNSYSKRLLDLTILMAFVGLIQLCVSVFSIPISSWTTKIIVFAIILYAINWITDNIKPSKSKKITPIKKIS
jgi:Mg2+ and Co2+ transporter CorA